MTKHTQIVKQGNENSASMLRRFTRRVQQSGVLGDAKKHRYFDRPLSPQMKKKKKLKQLERTEQVKWLIKIGRIADKSRS